ncbi:MAG: radical SAM family heme chaperone HemW [Gammaproteobacteria bacterium]
MTALQPPLSLYVHLPWCVRKCPYCDFNSHKAGDAAPRSRYIKALSADLTKECSRSANREIVSVFLGGGTPSLFSPEEIGEILGPALSGFRLAPDCEITMEANPGTIEHGRLVDYRRAGVTRLSIGAQSFSARSLQALGRIHGVEEIHSAYREATEAGFESVNIDLMFGLPGQNLARAKADVEALLALSPPHVSYYQLTLEPNTVFFASPPADLPDNDLCFEIQETCHDLLRKAGYGQYEISAFARDGHECRHNNNYWRFGDYLAAGAGAHGKLTDEDGSVWRYRKPANPLAFMEQAGTESLSDEDQLVSVEDLRFEFLLNALRLHGGFSAQEFTDRTGLSFAVIGDDLATAARTGLISCDGNEIWRPTELGFRYLNDLQAHFLPG